MEEKDYCFYGRGYNQPVCKKNNNLNEQFNNIKIMKSSDKLKCATVIETLGYNEVNKERGPKYVIREKQSNGVTP